MLSRPIQLPGVLAVRVVGLELLTVPLASLSVVTLEASSRVFMLFNIMSAASELEKGGGRGGRAFGEFEKNKGERGPLSA